MAYNPAEGNNPYDEVDYEKERKRLHSMAMDPAEKQKIKDEFLELLSKGANVSKALAVINGSDAWFGAKTSRVGRKTIYTWRRYEEDFRRDWDAAYALGTDRLEQRLEAFAFDEAPHLIERALKYRNPRRYATTRQEISGPDGGAIPVEQIELVAAQPESETPADDEGSA